MCWRLPSSAAAVRSLAHTTWKRTVAESEPLRSGGGARINPLRAWTKYYWAAGYFATAVVVVAFIWLFADLLLRSPEFYPAWDQRNFYDLARGALSKVQSIIAGEPNSWSLAGWGFASQYNMLFAIPLTPVFSAFGESWYVYGMAIAVI